MPAKSLALSIALAVASAGVLAGCIGKDDPGSAVDPKTLAGNSSNLNSTATPDGRGEIAAFKETNATEKGKGGMEHAHDYWAGETRKIIYQDDIGLIPLPLTPTGYPPGTSIADFNIPAPALVYEGTSSLELLFSNVNVLDTTQGLPTPTGGVPSQTVKILVDYITAADEPGNWHQAGTVTPEQPLVIPVKPLETDMPHSVASLWLFRIYTAQPDAFEFNLTMTAVKGNDVANWPPHPDLYANGPTRVIYDGPMETRVNDAKTFFLTGEDANWYYPEKVISYGTDKVTVEISSITFTAALPTTPTPTGYYLQYFNASFMQKIGNGRQWGGQAFDEASDGTTYHFEIPVNEYGFDSPYGTKSRWGFRIIAQLDKNLPDEAPVFGAFLASLVCPNCQEYRVSYNLKIVAYGHSTAEEGIDMMSPNLEESEEPAPPSDAGDGRAAPLAVPSIAAVPVARAGL